MNCINCFHHNACASVDLTGYVADIEREDGDCEHFITPEEVHPVARVVEIVQDFSSIPSDCIYVDLRCSNCNKLLMIKSYKTEDWVNYFKDHHELKYDDKCCPGCGAVIVEEEE